MTYVPVEGEVVPVPSVPVKFLWIDYGEPGKMTDMEQWYIFMPTEDNPIPHWEPQDIDLAPTDPSYVPGDPLPLLNGNIQVQVGY